MSDMISLVDHNDNIIGPVSKFDAHLRSNLESQTNKLSAHRAFSLFIFNNKNELLL